MVKTKNPSFLSIMLLPFSLVLALLCCLSGCARTETSEVYAESASFSQKEVSSASVEVSSEAAFIHREEELSSTSAEISEATKTGQADASEVNEPDIDEMGAVVVDELRHGEDHTFEQEIAYRYYHDGESRYELPDNYHNRWLADESVWAFDSNGNGVFAVFSGYEMHQSWYYFEYTNDYGETWTGTNEQGICSYIEDMKVDGNRVIISAGSSAGSSVAGSGHSLVYSHDHSETFDVKDITAFAPDALYEVMPENAGDLGMDILSIDSDGSLVLGWYMHKRINVAEFEIIDTVAKYKRDYFMIGKTDAKLTQCDVLYAAGDK